MYDEIPGFHPGATCVNNSYLFPRIKLYIIFYQPFRFNFPFIFAKRKIPKIVAMVFLHNH